MIISGPLDTLQQLHKPEVLDGLNGIRDYRRSERFDYIEGSTILDEIMVQTTNRLLKKLKAILYETTRCWKFRALPNFT